MGPVTRAVGQFIVPSLHPVAGQPQMLAGIVVDIMQMVYQVCRMLDCRPLLVGGGGVPNSRSLGSRSSLPDKKLAGVKPVVSCVDAR
jgi:hypothetical protein